MHDCPTASPITRTSCFGDWGHNGLVSHDLNLFPMSIVCAHMYTLTFPHPSDDETGDTMAPCHAIRIHFQSQLFVPPVWPSFVYPFFLAFWLGIVNLIAPYFAMRFEFIFNVNRLGAVCAHTCIQFPSLVHPFPHPFDGKTGDIMVPYHAIRTHFQRQTLCSVCVYMCIQSPLFVYSSFLDFLNRRSGLDSPLFRDSNSFSMSIVWERLVHPYPSPFWWRNKEHNGSISPDLNSIPRSIVCAPCVPICAFSPHHSWILPSQPSESGHDSLLFRDSNLFSMLNRLWTICAYMCIQSSSSLHSSFSAFEWETGKNR